MSATRVAPNELDALARREHAQPHSVLGAHPVNGGVVDPRAAPGRRDGRASSRPRASRSTLEQIHPAGHLRGHDRGRGAAAALQARGRLRRRREVHARGSVRVRADARRARPAPDRRGPPRAALREARRAPAHPRGRRPAPRSPSGPRPPGRSASSATSTPGTGACTRCARSARPGSGSCSCPTSATGARYKYEILTADGELTLKADPFAQETEVPPQTASVVTRSAPRVEQGGRRLSRAARASAAARRSRSRSTRSTSAPGG